MRWTTQSTWIRIAVLFGIYLLVLAAWFSVSRVSDSMEIVKSLVFLILLVILPILAMAFGAWDGVKEGFSLLWLLAPFVCFLAPMYLFLNASALIYGWLQHPWIRGPIASVPSSMRVPRGGCRCATGRFVSWTRLCG